MGYSCFTKVSCCYCTHMPACLAFLPICATAEQWRELSGPHSASSSPPYFKAASTVHMSTSVSQLVPLPSFPLLMSMFVLHVCVYSSALHITSSKPFFYITHIGVNIFVFSDTSLCMTVFKSIHISTNDLILFLFMAEYIILSDAIINVFSFIICFWAYSLLMYKNASDFSAHFAFCYLAVSSDRVFFRNF